MTITTQFNFNVNYSIKILQETDEIYKDIENIYNVSKINDDVSEVSISNNMVNSQFIDGTDFTLMSEPLVSLFEKNIYINKDIVISSKPEEVNSGLTPQIPDITKYKYVVRDELNSYVFRNNNPFPNMIINKSDLISYINQEYTASNLGDYYNRSIIARRLIPTYSINTNNLTVTYQFPHGGHSKGDSFYYLLDSTNILRPLPSEFAIDYLEGVIEYQNDIASLQDINIVGIYNIEKVWVDGLGNIELNSDTKTKYQSGFNTFKNITYNNDVIKADKISNTSYILYFYKDCIIQPIEPNTISIDGLILNRYNSGDDNSEIIEKNIIPAKTEILVNQVSIPTTDTDGYNDSGAFVDTITSSFNDRNTAISTLFNNYLNTLVQDAYAYNSTNGLIITPLDQLEKGNASFSFLFNDGDAPSECTPTSTPISNFTISESTAYITYSINGGPQLVASITESNANGVYTLTDLFYNDSTLRQYINLNANRGSGGNTAFILGTDINTEGHLLNGLAISDLSSQSGSHLQSTSIIFYPTDLTPYSANNPTDALTFLSSSDPLSSIEIHSCVINNYPGL